MLVSVITPVYNTEKYLDECIGSILSQSMTDFELLLIDDGSTDGSGAICDRYAEKDKRIRVFHIPNGGVSAARNLGLDNARGEFVVFVDSDDRVTPDHLQQLADSNIGEDGVAFTNLFEERPASGQAPQRTHPDLCDTGLPGHGWPGCLHARTGAAAAQTLPRLDLQQNVLARHDRTAAACASTAASDTPKTRYSRPSTAPISPTSSATATPHTITGTSPRVCCAER